MYYEQTSTKKQGLTPVKTVLTSTILSVILYALSSNSYVTMKINATTTIAVEQNSGKKLQLICLDVSVFLRN